MSELSSTRNDSREFRWQLLATVSAVALLASFTMRDAKAADQDADRPTVWIELGGQLERAAGQGNSFAPGFLTTYQNSPVLQPTTPLQAQNPPPFSFAEDGKISFQPNGWNWIFFAAVNYGRSSNFKHVDQQTNRVGPPTHGFYISHGRSFATTADFADTQVHRRESHTILDFVVGKDVGLGMFGRESSSTLGFGIRFAQFESNTTFDVRARPDLHVKYYPAQNPSYALPYFHTYHATGSASRSFHGIGPSLSWNGSTPFAGNSQNGEISIDWGVNAAFLFGKQMTRVRHQESAHYRSAKYALTHSSNVYEAVYQHIGEGHNTDRSVAVPNAGAFAGASYRIENFKVSAGYRADFFFGAIDGGIDTRKSETLGFYGPFATVSVGLGGREE